MKPANLLILILAAVLTASSCKESITDSRPRIIRPPQDMIWTADTIRGLDQYAQLTPRNLYVFSANDAWLTCWSDIARGLIWHWDGKSWNESDIRKDVGGMRIQDVCGYSSSDLWACGYSGEEIFLAHYNGTKWTKYNTNGIKGELLDMCKDADGNILACGRNGLIMKYDKTSNKWNVSYIKMSFNYDSEFFIKNIAVINKDLYATAAAMNLKTLEEMYYFVKGKFENYTLVDSIKLDFTQSSNLKWGNWRLINEGETGLFSSGLGGCWKYLNSNWIKILNYDGEIYDITGFNTNYLVACGAFKTILFYNGSSWSNFSNSLKVFDNGFKFRCVFTNGFETFIAGYGKENKLIVWRGN